MRQVQTTTSRPGYKVEATIQVQRGAPARLLVGTDLLPRLGFLFVCTGQGSEDTDLLDSQVLSGNLGISSRGVADRDQENSVCLLRTARLPGVCAKIAPIQESSGASYFFERSFELGRKGVLLSEAAVEPDADNCGVVFLENRRCELVEVEEGQVLGRLHEAKLWVDTGNESQEEQGDLVSAVMQSDFNKESLQRLKDGWQVEERSLVGEEMKCLKSLVCEYADVFALLDSSELGSTDLVTHTIDTGDSPPIKWSTRRTTFALRQVVEEMVEMMLEQEVVEPSHSPVVLVEKKDGSKRFCIDYHRLNSVTKMDVFPLPRIDDTLDFLAQSNISQP